MKRLIPFLYLSVALLLTSCYDDSAILNKLNDHERRIEQLEELCKQMNTNISSLQAIVTVLQNNDFVTAVVPVEKGGEVIGYTISFSKSKSITIYHGTDGKNGQDGQTPTIGVRMGNDGCYYWTLNGEWMIDDDGNRIPATGADGQDGQPGAPGETGQPGQGGKDGITPMLKIEDGYWYVSYDNGANWDKLGAAVGEAGSPGDSMFKDVIFDAFYMYITFNDGTQIAVPIEQEFKLELASYSVTCTGNKTYTVAYTITGTYDDIRISTISEGGYTTYVKEYDKTSGEIVIEINDNAKSGKVLVMANSGDRTVIQTVNINYRELSFVPSVWSATYAKFNITLDKCFRCAYFLPLKLNKSNYDGAYNSAKYYMEASESVRAELAARLADVGWGMASNTYGKDTFKTIWEHINLEQNTQYVMAYCAKTIDGEITDVYFSEPFQMKEWTWAYGNASDINMNILDITDMSFKVEFTYDPNNTAVVRFVSIWNGDDAGFPGKDASQETLKEWFEGIDVSYVNVLCRVESGYDSFFVGYVPSDVDEVTYVYFAEDMNGYMSEIKLKTVTLE